MYLTHIPLSSLHLSYFKSFFSGYHCFLLYGLMCEANQRTGIVSPPDPMSTSISYIFPNSDILNLRDVNALMRWNNTLTLHREQT